MPELISTITLGLAGARMLAGVIGVSSSFFNEDFAGSNADPLNKLKDSIFGEFIGGLASGWAKEAKDFTIGKFYDQVINIDRNNLNHDLQRAARKAQLIATLWACEASLKEIKDEQQLNLSKTKAFLKSWIWAEKDTKWLQGLKDWIKAELKIIDKIPPQIDINYEDVYRIFDLNLSLSASEAQKSFIKAIIDSTLEEIRSQPYKRFGITIEDSDTGYDLIKSKITEGWQEFIPNDNYLTELNLSDKNLSDTRKNENKWFWLLCNVFTEEYKTNERLKAAMLKKMLLEQRKILFDLSFTVSIIDSDLKQLKAQQNEFVELLKKIELEIDRDDFYLEYLRFGEQIIQNELLNNATAKAFVRKNEEQVINNFINNNKSGYLIIKAKAGLGKTSLLANWVNQQLYQNENSYGKRKFIASYFFNQKSGTTSLTRCFTDLLYQLCIYHTTPKEFPEDIGLLQSTVLGLIRKEKSKENEPLVIVFDALDEAEGKINHFLNPLPDGVYVIVSIRADENEVPPYFSSWEELIAPDKSNLLYLKNLDDVAVRNWLWITEPIFSLDDDLVNKVYEKTDGLPLYLNYLIDDLVREKAKGKTIEDLKLLLQTTPKGFSNYVNKQYSDLSQSLSNDWQNKIDSLICSLCVSLGALDNYDIKNLTGITQTEIEGFPPRAWRWVRIVDDLERNKIFYFDHLLIRDVFVKKFEDELENTLEKLLNYCSRWSEHEKNHYALLHYSEHLFQLQKFQELYKLAKDKSFLESQTRTFPNQPTINLQTIQTALQGAMEADDASEIVEFMLRHTTQVLELSNKSPLDALGQSYDRAILQAELIFSRDIERGTLWFLLLAKVLSSDMETGKSKEILNILQVKKLSRFTNNIWEELAIIAFVDLFKINVELVTALQQKLLTDSGRERLINNLLKDENKNEIKSSFQIAVELSQLIDDQKTRIKVLNFIADTQAQADNTDEAKALLNESLKVAIQINDWQYRRGTLKDIFQTYSKIIPGNLEGAIKMAEMITDTKISDEALDAIGIIQIDRGYIKEAIKTTEIFNHADKSDFVLVHISQAQSKAGNIDEAIEIAKKINSKSWFSWALDDIGKAQSIAGDKNKANKTFETALSNVDEESGTVMWRSALIRIIDSQITYGNADEGIKNAETTGDRSIIAHALGSLARLQFNSGNLNAALKTAGMIENRWDQARAIDSFVRNYISAGKMTEAIEVADNIISKGDRVATLCSIAEAQITVGNNKEARKTFSKSIKIAKTIDNKRECADAFVSIVRSQSNSGNIVEAIETAQMIKYDWKTSDSHGEWAFGDALILIIKALCDSGKIEEAINVAELIEEDWRINDKSHITALSYISYAQIEAGNVEGATNTARKINDELSRNEALSFIIQAQVKAGNMDGANKLFAETLIIVNKEVKNEWRHAETTTNIALAQVEAGSIEEANKTFDKAIESARKLTDIWNQAHVLRFIAEVQINVGNIDAATRILDEAFKIAKKINIEWRGSGYLNDDERCASLLSSIAVAQTNSGQLNKAIKTVNIISDNAKRSLALSAIAKVQADSNELKEANKTLDEALRVAMMVADEATIYHGTLRAIALIRADLKDIDEAIKIANIKTKEGHVYRAEILAYIVKVQADSGKIEEAIKTSNMIMEKERPPSLLNLGGELQANTNRIFVEALCHIAEAQAKIDSIVETHKTLSKAILLVGTINHPIGRPDNDNRAYALAMIAKSQAITGNVEGSTDSFDKAIETAEQISFEADRHRSLASIVHAQAQSGNISSAIKTAELILNEKYLAKAIASIIKYESDSNQTNELLRLTKLFLIERDQYLPIVASEFAEKKNKKVVKELIIPTSYYLDAVFRMIAVIALLYSEQSNNIAKKFEVFEMSK